jgi:hypothetical protein
MVKGNGMGVRAGRRSSGLHQSYRPTPGERSYLGARHTTCTQRWRLSDSHTKSGPPPE